MQIVVIEDNKEINNFICNNINHVLKNNNWNYYIQSFTNYSSDLKEIIHNRKTKVYIIDMVVGEYSGYDICREIREKAFDWDSFIIIASVHNQKENIISLRLSIFTYISKLYEFETNLKDSIIHVINIIERKKIIEINKDCKIPINDICYITKEKNSKYCYIKTISNEFRTRKTLKYLESELNLTRIKKYILINNYNVEFRTKEYIKFKNNISLDIV